MKAIFVLEKRVLIPALTPFVVVVSAPT